MSTFVLEDHVQEIARCLSVIEGGDPYEQYKAAQTIRSLGVDRLGNNLPRGTPERAAKNAFPNPTDARTVIRVAAATARQDLRHELVCVLSLWAGDEAVDFLSHCLTLTGDHHLVGLAICALGSIGGPRAVKVLESLTDEPFKFWARSALGELESGGTPDHAEGLVPRDASFDF